MLLSNPDEILDVFKMFVPYYLLLALPLMIIISPVNPVAGAHEFPAFRMQQYDLHGVPHGKFYLGRRLDFRGYLCFQVLPIPNYASCEVMVFMVS